MLRKTIVDTYDLKKPEVFDLYIKKGYKWIKKYKDISFENLITNKDVGCLVQLFIIKENDDCVSIHSDEAKKLINYIN